MFVANGILFNHESPIRGLEFVTRKVTNAVARIKLGLQNNVHLGNLNAIRDWGFAGDYVEAMWLMLQQDVPDNYVISTGTGHTVREFVEFVFKEGGLNWDEYVSVDPAMKRVNDVDFLVGDNSKARQDLGWKPKTSFNDLLRLMYQEDLRRWSDTLAGKEVVWDAPAYSGELKIASVRYSVRV